MRCIDCGSELIWGADFNSEDYGFEEGGIVSNYHCPNCDKQYLILNDKNLAYTYRETKGTEVCPICEERELANVENNQYYDDYDLKIYVCNNCGAYVEVEKYTEEDD